MSEKPVWSLGDSEMMFLTQDQRLKSWREKFQGRVKNRSLEPDRPELESWLFVFRAE